jgi:2-haloacid dehalogenase
VNTEPTNPTTALSSAPAPRYEWLLFDADGTLFDFERAECAALEQTFQQIGLAFAPAHLTTYRQINHALWQGVERGELKPAFVKLRRFELLLEALQLTHSPAAFSAAYLECLATCSQLMTGAEEALRTLRARYRMAIVTNGLTVVQRGRLTRSVIRPHIDELIISEEIGFAKPAREFFDTTFARIGDPAKQAVLMIGDGWASDIQGAAQYGLDACWFNPSRLPRPATPQILREVASFQELLAWLG